VVALRSTKEIDRIRDASKIVAEVLLRLKDAAKPGVSTGELDQIAEQTTLKLGGRPAFKGYLGFPACLCTSVNNRVVHGIPRRDEVLKDGDIIGLDYGVEKEGYYGDSAITVPIGPVSELATKLMKVTEECLYLGIEQTRIGNRISDIGYVVQKHAEENGFSVVREFVGHGIGTKPHEDPQIPNYGQPGRGLRIKAGMVLALEPMVNEGNQGVEILKDGWTVLTLDRKLSAHFEHTVAVSENGPEILTRV
jgi:methionyl aminopeptidase